MNVTQAELESQLHAIKANGLFDKMHAAATDAGIPLAYFLAVGSRETNLVNELGDYEGGAAQGVGIVQIDVQHEIAREARDSGSWRTDPQPLILWGASLLGQNIRRAEAAFPHFDEDQHLKIAASGYNAGIDTAIQGSLHHGDSDYFTTGKDYGADVMERMAAFAALLA